MAARRLLIVMVVLLMVSTLAAALVQPPPPQTTTTTTAPTTMRPEPERGGRLIRVSVPVPRSSERLIELRAGDQLALTVTSPDPGEISLPDFGLIEFAGPGDPARFDVLVERPGRYPVRYQDGATIATIVAERRRRAQR